MVSVNIPIKKAPIYTYEGGKAKHITYEQELRRTVMSCLLWENSFYESDISISDRIVQQVADFPLKDTPIIAAMAMEARTKMNLRHVPLLLVRELVRRNNNPHSLPFSISLVINDIIQRADELAEFLGIYWKDGRQPLSAQVKKGLAKAFKKFNRYQLAKYNRDNIIKLRDVLFLVHAKPKSEEQAKDWKDLVEGTLESPDTWEVALSSGANRKETWIRLLQENKLGALALLRNLRNMNSVGVEKAIIVNAINNISTEKVLPFRFISAARHAVGLEPQLEAKMFEALETKEHFKGRTILLVDVSGSMDSKISNNSEVTRIDAACGLAMMARELSNDIDVFSFSTHLRQVPTRRGFGLADAIKNSQTHRSTYLGKALETLAGLGIWDRLIVITDEQCQDDVPNLDSRAYLINVAPYENGVGYSGKWVHIDGWSDSILDYIIEYEKEMYDNS